MKLFLTNYRYSTIYFFYHVGDYDCDYDLDVCVGETRSSGCFPITVSASASLLTIDDINAIKFLWEENGANCTLN
jgi:hypothetical protein